MQWQWKYSCIKNLFFFYAVGPVEQLGSLVSGSIDLKFDGGYIVSVNLGSAELKGVLYHIPINESRSSYTASMPSSQNRKRSRLGLRDPSRPKSNRSGYNFFFAEHYTKLKPSYSGQERAISKRIGYLWNHLTEAERQVQIQTFLPSDHVCFSPLCNVTY